MTKLAKSLKGLAEDRPEFFKKRDGKRDKRDKNPRRKGQTAKAVAQAVPVPPADNITAPANETAQPAGPKPLPTVAAAVTPPPAPAPVAAKPVVAKPSILSLVLGANSRLTASTIGQDLQNDRDLRTPAGVGAFMNAMVQAEVLGTAKLVWEVGEANAHHQWQAMDLRGVKKELRKWANEDGGENAQGILAIVEAFEKVKAVSDLVGEMWDLYVNVIRPLGQVTGIVRLHELLQRIYKQEKGVLMYREPKKGHREETSPKKVVLTNNTDRGTVAVVYQPWADSDNKVSPKAEACWKYVVDAHNRVQGKNGLTFEGLQAEAEATETTPENIVEKKSGKIFLAPKMGTGPKRGALLAVSEVEGGVGLTVVKTVAMAMAKTDRPIGYFAKEGDWIRAGVGELYQALEAWKNQG